MESWGGEKKREQNINICPVVHCQLGSWQRGGDTGRGFPSPSVFPGHGVSASLSCRNFPALHYSFWSIPCCNMWQLIRHSNVSAAKYCLPKRFPPLSYFFIYLMTKSQKEVWNNHHNSMCISNSGQAVCLVLTQHEHPQFPHRYICVPYNSTPFYSGESHPLPGLNSFSSCGWVCSVLKWPCQSVLTFPPTQFSQRFLIITSFHSRRRSFFSMLLGDLLVIVILGFPSGHLVLSKLWKQGSAPYFFLSSTSYVYHPHHITGQIFFICPIIFRMISPS